jgi:CDP-glycerol glycerophosphotransferase (TagB/SpsB family)
MTNFYYYGFSGGFAFAQLDMEIRLVKILRANGYYIVYKPHPMTMNEVEGVFDNYVDEIVEGKYENVYDIADCVLLGDYSTSTFGFTLLTNKPIVLIDIKGNFRFPKSFELLSKRCSIVMADIDDSGRIIFDKNEVLNAVEESIDNINYDILYKYAF